MCVFAMYILQIAREYLSVFINIVSCTRENRGRVHTHHNDSLAQYRAPETIIIRFRGRENAQSRDLIASNSVHGIIRMCERQLEI